MIDVYRAGVRRKRKRSRESFSRRKFTNHNGLPWRDAPGEYAPHHSLCNRWMRWSEKGIFAQIMAGEHGEAKTVMIDATELKAYRTATSLAAEKRGVDT